MQYPLCRSNPYCGNIFASSHISLSRVTFATIEADAIETHRASPRIIVCDFQGSLGARLPSIKTYDGVKLKLFTASCMAHRVALRILLESMRWRSAKPMPKRSFVTILLYNSSRFVELRRFESEILASTS